MLAKNASRASEVDRRQAKYSPPGVARQLPLLGRDRRGVPRFAAEPQWLGRPGRLNPLSRVLCLPTPAQNQSLPTRSHLW